MLYKIINVAKKIWFAFDLAVKVTSSSLSLQYISKEKNSFNETMDVNKVNFSKEAYVNF